jgi:kynurenine formamidase
MAIDAISTDHPFNTKVRDARRDLIPEVEKKIGMSMDKAFPWPAEYQATHTLLFPKGVFHVENVGGDVDLVLNQRVWVGAFPFRFKGGEAAFCRFVAFVER